jgi:PPM family protein phosphatase
MAEQQPISAAALNDLDIGSSTDVGRIREANEDSMLALRPDGARAGQTLIAVADGMGGHKAGEVASALAVETLGQALAQVDPADSAESWLHHAITLANQTIWESAAVDLDREGMGTTLVCALLNANGQALIANVGDSRAYSVSDGAARLVTSDHTWVNQQVEAGQMSEREARVSPFRSLLTRSLGSAPQVEMDLFPLQLGAGDALVLVSDGVTTYLDEGDVGVVLRESHSAQEAAERLVAEAVKRGGADNATAVVVRRKG